MMRRICDYCSQPHPQHSISLSRTPNAEEVRAEICDFCLEEISGYLRFLKTVRNNTLPKQKPNDLKEGLYEQRGT